MLKVFPINFPDGNSAQATSVKSEDKLKEALVQLGVPKRRYTFVLVGGAGGMDEDDLNRLSFFFINSLCPVFEKLRAIVIDGGTDAGIMKLIGETRKTTNSTFPLVGVVSHGNVQLPDSDEMKQSIVNLESNHTHFVFVPGNDWGDESFWLDKLAQAAARKYQSATILINGGEIARNDIEFSIKAKRPIIIVSGTGRLADELAMKPEQSLLYRIINLTDDPKEITQSLIN